MFHFTVKVTTVYNSRETVPYERNRVPHKYDSGAKNNHTNMSKIERKNMNWEQAEISRNKSDDQWVDFVLKKNKESMQDFLSFVVSVPIIDFSHIRNFSWIFGNYCSCYSSFHNKFTPLKNVLSKPTIIYYHHILAT